MADVLGKKISELAETTDLAGLYTIGSDRNNQSKKVPLQFVKEAADYANAQGDYAKGVGDNIQGNTGVNEYPAFSSSTQYAAGSVVRYNNKLYRFTAIHPAGAWVGTDAIETSIKAETDVKLTELESETKGLILALDIQLNKSNASEKNSLLFEDGKIYQYRPYTDGYGVTDFVDIHGKSALNILSNCYQYPDRTEEPRFAAICFYDENKALLGNYTSDTYNGEDVVGVIDIPRNAYYFRAVTKNQDLPLVWNLAEDNLTKLSQEVKSQESAIVDINEYLKREKSNAYSLEKDALLLKDGKIYQYRPYTDGYGVTDFIAIENQTKLNIISNCFQFPDDSPTRFAAICFYDENKQIVSYYEDVITEVKGVISIPKGAYYFRAVTKNQDLPLVYSLGAEDAMSLISELQQKILFPKCVVKYVKDSDTFEVYQRYESDIYFMLTMNHLTEDYSVNNTNLWRIASSGGVYRYVKGNFVALNIKLLNSPENEFAMRFVNTVDFIGGYHGNERFDVNDGFAKFFIDGIEVTDLTNDFSIECQDFYMLQKSTLYMNSASSQMVAGNPIVGTHYKKTTFAKNGYDCYNRVEFDISSTGKAELEVDTWFSGICCVAKDCATAAYADNFQIIDTSKVDNVKHQITNAILGDVVMMGTKGLSCNLESEVLTEENKGCRIVIWDRVYGDTKYYRYAPTKAIKTGDIFANRQSVTWTFKL